MSFVEQFATGTLPPIGHNNPPPDTLEERLAVAAADLIKERDTKYANPIEIWSGRTEIADDAQQEAATNFIKKTDDLVTRFEAVRVREKEPFKVGVDTVDGYFRDIRVPLQNAAAHVRKLDAAFKGKKLAAERAERERLAAEAVRLAASAKTEDQAQKAVEIASAAAAPIEPIRTRTSTGILSSGRVEYVATVIDINHVPREFLSYDEAKAKAWLRGLPKDTVPPPQPGMKFTETVKSSYR